MSPNMYKNITLMANAQGKLLLENACGTKYVQNRYLERQMLKKIIHRKMHLTPTYVQNHYFEGKCPGNGYLKMHLTPNMYKIITLKANAHEIVTLKCIWHQHMYKTHYFQGKCSENHHCKMCLTPNMYKIMSLWRQMLRTIVTVKCVWHHISAKIWLWRQMIRTSLLENAFGTIYVQNPLLCRQMLRKSLLEQCIWQHICTKSLLWRQLLKEIRHFKMHLTSNMYIIITLKANVQQHFYFKMHLTPHIYKIVTLKANAQKIVTWTCIWQQICTANMLQNC